MRFIQAGVVFGALAFSSSCTVPSEPPVSSTKQVGQLTAEEIIDVCDWAVDYLGGYNWNQEDGDDENPTVRHRCPLTMEELADRDNNEVRYVYYNEDSCSEGLSALADASCSPTVGDYAYFIQVSADAPCEYHVVPASNGCGSFTWTVEN
ncbi:hypothetical protein [Haliangium ochraceum]|uniref:Lipoprotein n=1 Tax=Haliangium ochraceum (strain DSM 14365 / JCM 11303 / SMP-2) TaxID=502025 RepID=D0LK20_HALO1|nr:hypothetical protein [Haliangium ochraceum]ACY18527.1 hypothetical protein Hoch_6052 [Haliangium ochraceum DSM 14365]